MVLLVSSPSWHCEQYANICQMGSSHGRESLYASFHPVQRFDACLWSVQMDCMFEFKTIANKCAGLKFTMYAIPLTVTYQVNITDKISQALNHKKHGLHLRPSPTHDNAPLRRRRHLRHRPLQALRSLPMASHLHFRPNVRGVDRILHLAPPSSKHHQPDRPLLSRSHAHLYRTVSNEPRGLCLDL